ncbi:MAG: thiamine pyrophosphate-binding protein, partial [Dehalococcoidia bacterium]
MPVYGSDIIVDLMKALGIEYVAMNPGATFRGIHDSIVNHGGNAHPEIIECLHEEIAVAMAHGYAKATGKPMVAITHDIVGLQHASMAIFNAWCDRVPLLILGGTGPMDTSKRRPWIDWIHTALVQGNLVRDFVKWDDQPTTMTSAVESLLRAWAVAQTEPKGPVYICFDVELQEGELPQGFPLPDVGRYPVPSTIYPDPSLLEQAANWMVEADFPVIIADRMGRDGDAVGTLTELAEMLSIPVLDGGDHFNFANTHPLDLTGAEADVLSRADLVLALEVDDLFGALHKVDMHQRQFVPTLSEKARIVHISLKDQLIRSWATDYQRLQAVDLSIAAHSAAALSQLLVLCRKLSQGLGTQKKRTLEERKAALGREHDELRARWRADAERS